MAAAGQEDGAGLFRGHGVCGACVMMLPRVRGSDSAALLRGLAPFMDVPVREDAAGEDIVLFDGGGMMRADTRRDVRDPPSVS